MLYLLKVGSLMGLQLLMNLSCLEAKHGENICFAGGIMEAFFMFTWGSLGSFGGLILVRRHQKQLGYDLNLIR